MRPLEKSLRNKLERTVKDARDIAETAARAVLEQLGVGEASPYTHLTDNEKELRRKLRVHGRQLGDLRNATTEAQELSRLIEEVAYEHWHRMLFARFLAENNLLMFDGVAVTLVECEDLAADEGAANGWELASRCAAKMLPQIFRPDSPVFQLHFAANHQLPLEKLISDLPLEVFIASDSLGWVYQFWQADSKERINKSEVKIGARELPAVTQLFTEPYMVAFLLDNALGVWWVAKVAGLKDGKELRTGARQLLRTAETEDELREFFSLPGVPLEYLRFVKEDNGEWQPAASTFDGWPENLSDLKVLDPCCGSGHFLVAAFLMLVPMRMELDHLTAKEAVNAVLRENIHGLELDQRCVELAAFALALTAWRYPDAGGYRPLPELNVACSGLAVSVAKDEWKELALGKHNLRLALDWMYEVFKDAPVLGSLLNPAKSDAAKLVSWEELSVLLGRALLQEAPVEIENAEMGIVAQGLAKTATLLAAKYHFVVTNVPYLKRGNQNEVLKEFSENYYPDSQKDLATVFLERCLEFCRPGSPVCVVLPQNWLFLTTYKKLRYKLLQQNKWNAVVALGSGAFETISGEVVKAILLVISSKNNINDNTLFSTYSNHTDDLKILALDVSSDADSQRKSESLQSKKLEILSQIKQLENPDARFSITHNNYDELIGDNAITAAGFSTFDRPRFIFNFWEIDGFKNGWMPCQSTVNSIKPFGGCELAFLWEKGEGQLCQFMEDKKRFEGYTSGIWRAGSQFWGNHGVLVSLMGKLPASIYCGGPFDQNTALLVPKSPDKLPALWAYCSSNEFGEAVRKVDQSIKVTTATLEKIPVKWSYWAEIADEKYPNGLPKPYTDDPTQWIFHGHPAQSDFPLQVAVARLLGYHWPKELDSSMELSDVARAWVKKSEELLPHADDDGIVCIPPVRGEMKADSRLENLLAAAFGKEWSSSKKSGLLAQADHAGKSMESWLRDKFFVQHCKLFQHRPFVWQIWDGLNDGFSALVNYHKLDHKTLETLIYTYLGDWIRTQKDAIAHGTDGAEEKLAAAEQLKKKLELILEGEAPYDIFVRWKPLDKQPIGWNPDLNDGVRLNIRPFITAGVLRFNKKPQINISWDKDRGKDVESAPWYHLFNGDRINEYHLSLPEKRAAREERNV